MNTFQAMSHSLILQGEVGIREGYDFTDIKLHTPTPTSCNLMTLHSQKKKMGVLAHVDDYVSVDQLFFTLNEKLEYKFGQPLEALDFQAKIMGGTHDKYSLKQQDKLIFHLGKNHIPYEKIEFDQAGERPQIILHANGGKIDYLFGKQKDLRIEYLQKREYYAFNHYQLDVDYPQSKASTIPEFVAIVAIRSMHTLPPFEIEDLSDDSVRRILSLEDSGQLSLPMTSWQRTAILSKETAIKTLTALVKKQQRQCLSDALQTENYNLMLRQSCFDATCLDLTRYLVTHRFSLKLDLNAKGAKSGSALEIAKNKGNAQAKQLLKSALT